MTMMAQHWLLAYLQTHLLFDSFVNFQWIRTSIIKQPYIFVIFQRGGPDPLSLTSGSAHVISYKNCLFLVWLVTV